VRPSGRLLHTVTLDQGVGLAAAGERRGLVLVAGDRGVSVLDARSGALVRTSMLDGQSGHVLRTIGVRPAQTNGLFDVEATLSRLIALDERSGRVLVGNPSPYRFPNRPCPGRCPPLPPILTGPGSVSVLDAATGTLLRAVVGRAPLVMAVDDIAGHAIILNADDIGPQRKITGRLGCAIRVRRIARPHAINTVAGSLGSGRGNCKVRYPSLRDHVEQILLGSARSHKSSSPRTRGVGQAPAW
jgi:hypothetical protein